MEVCSTGSPSSSSSSLCLLLCTKKSLGTLEARTSPRDNQLISAWRSHTLNAQLTHIGRAARPSADDPEVVVEEVVEAAVDHFVVLKQANGRVVLFFSRILTHYMEQDSIL